MNVLPGVFSYLHEPVYSKRRMYHNHRKMGTTYWESEGELYFPLVYYRFTDKATPSPSGIIEVSSHLWFLRVYKYSLILVWIVLFLRLTTYFESNLYIGGESFGLRAKAHNFTIEQMTEAAEYCHDRGVRLYVTANIFAHNDDLEGIRAYFEQLKPVGIDALIISDPAVFMLAKEILPAATHPIFRIQHFTIL